jgi:CheY-like chemotaxis protein
MVPLFLDNANPSARVLVVDNGLHIRDLITPHLTKAAFRIKTVTASAEAWDPLQANNNPAPIIPL